MKDERDGGNNGDQQRTGHADVPIGDDGRTREDDDVAVSGSGLTKAEWERVPSDPDLRENLGYELEDWEEFATLDGSDQMMFLPEDESLLREDAFVVASEDSVVDLGCRY